MGVILILDGVPQRVRFGDDERNGTYPLFPSAAIIASAPLSRRFW
jgi:hypothetical protein